MLVLDSFLALLNAKYIMIAGQELDVTTLDSTVWDFSKYIMVASGMLIVWLIKTAIDIFKGMKETMDKMALDMAVMKSNSDNTKEQLTGIRQDIEDVTHKLQEHDRRLLYIERQIKVS